MSLVGTTLLEASGFATNCHTDPDCLGNPDMDRGTVPRPAHIRSRQLSHLSEPTIWQSMSCTLTCSQQRRRRRRRLVRGSCRIISASDVKRPCMDLGSSAITVGDLSTWSAFTLSSVSLGSIVHNPVAPWIQSRDGHGTSLFIPTK